MNDEHRSNSRRVHGLFSVSLLPPSLPNTPRRRPQILHFYISPPPPLPPLSICPPRPPPRPPLHPPVSPPSPPSPILPSSRFSPPSPLCPPLRSPLPCPPLSPPVSHQLPPTPPSLFFAIFSSMTRLFWHRLPDNEDVRPPHEAIAVFDLRGALPRARDGV